MLQQEDCRRSELNILDLPRKYKHLYSEESYKYLVSGCIHSDNWGEIKRQHVSNLQGLIHSMPLGKVVYVYVTTSKNDTSKKYFGLALVSGRKMNENEAGRAVSYIRRMYTGLYKDMKTLFAHTDKEFMKKFRSDPKAQKSCYTDWNCCEYKTVSWLYNDLSSNEYMEVIFSSSIKRSELESVHEYKFDEYDSKNPSWPMPERQS